MIPRNTPTATTWSEPVAATPQPQPHKREWDPELRKPENFEPKAYTAEIARWWPGSVRAEFRLIRMFVRQNPEHKDTPTYIKMKDILEAKLNTFGIYNPKKDYEHICHDNDNDKDSSGVYGALEHYARTGEVVKDGLDSWQQQSIATETDSTQIRIK